MADHITDKAVTAAAKAMVRVTLLDRWEDLDEHQRDVYIRLARAALPVLNTTTDETADQFPGFYITNDDGYPALTFYPREDDDGEHVKTADAGTSLDELIEAARKHTASLRGEQG